MEGKTRMVAGCLPRSLRRRRASGCKVGLVGNGAKGSLKCLVTVLKVFSPGLRDPTKEETFEASEEECAKECYYSKR